MPMPKAIEDSIDGETFRAIKGLPLPAMNSHLYTIYAAGYAAGLSDAGGEKLRARPCRISPARSRSFSKQKREGRAVSASFPYAGRRAAHGFLSFCRFAHGRSSLARLKAVQSRPRPCSSLEVIAISPKHND